MADSTETKTATAAAKPQTKTAFVLGFPRETPVADVVAKGKAAGFAISVDHVHKIRSVAKVSAKKKRAAKKAAKAPTAAKAKKQTAKSRAKKPGAKKGAPKAIAAAAPKSNVAFGSKKAFVESMPRTTPASEVVAAGKKQGIVLSTGYIYVLRSKSAAKGPKGSTKRGPGRPKGSKNKAPAATAKLTTTPAKSVNGSTMESVLRRLVLDHGRNRVRDELSKVEASVAKLLSHQ
ncbi:MAG: hypothetical protein ACHREM_01895 [Polyangiales bacterium]